MVEQGFATIPRHVLYDASLPADAKMIYLVLSSYVGSSEAAWPSHATIAEVAGLSVATVKRRLQLLREHGLVEWETRILPGHMQRTNVYKVIAGSDRKSATVGSSQGAIAQTDPKLTQHHPKTLVAQPERKLTVSEEVKATTKTKEPSTSFRIPASTEDPRWVKFWTTYPRRQGKADAFKRYALAIRRGVDPEAIQRAAEQYAASRQGEDPTYTAMPSTWLNQGRWDDELPVRPSAAVVDRKTFEEQRDDVVAERIARRSATKWAGATG